MGGASCWCQPDSPWSRPDAADFSTETPAAVTESQAPPPTARQTGRHHRPPLARLPLPSPPLSHPGASSPLVGSQQGGGGGQRAHINSYWSWEEKLRCDWLTTSNRSIRDQHRRPAGRVTGNVMITDQRYMPRLSTWVVARKSPVGDIDTLTGAIATRKQSTRLTREKITFGSEQSPTVCHRIISAGLLHSYLPEGRSHVRIVQSIATVTSHRPSGLKVCVEQKRRQILSLLSSAVCSQSI